MSEDITIKKSTYNNMIKVIVAAIAIATFVGGYSLGVMDNSNLISSEEIKEMILDANGQAKVAAQPSQGIQPNVPSIISVSLDDDPVKGNPNAPITIIEFSDFQCPYCSKFHTQTLPELEKNYIQTGKVKFVYRDLPLASHANAMPASIAAECADEQGKFWEYHDILFKNQGVWNALSSDAASDRFSAFAVELGMNPSSFESCLGSSKIADEVTKDSIDARKYGATGTPTFFIGNEKDGFTKLVGAQAFASFAAAIDVQLKS